MMKKRVNVEFSHVYLGQPLREYHINGAKIAKQIIEILKRKNYAITSNVWIDDIHLRKKVDKFEFAKGYIEKIKKHTEIVPDFYAFESEVKKVSTKFLNSIPKHIVMRRKGHIYVDAPNPILIKKGSEHICCFLSATYALAKLGCFKIPFYKFKKSDKKFEGNLQITVLPMKYFKEEEHKTKHLIKVSRYSNYLNKALWVWYSNKKIPSNKQLFKEISNFLK